MARRRKKKRVNWYTDLNERRAKWQAYYHSHKEYERERKIAWYKKNKPRINAYYRLQQRKRRHPEFTQREQVALERLKTLFAD